MTLIAIILLMPVALFVYWAFLAALCSQAENILGLVILGGQVYFAFILANTFVKWIAS